MHCWGNSSTKGKTFQIKKVGKNVRIELPRYKQMRRKLMSSVKAETPLETKRLPILMDDTDSCLVSFSCISSVIIKTVNRSNVSEKKQKPFMISSEAVFFFFFFF